MYGPFAEEWRDVPGFEDFYSVSNYGRVWSKERRVVDNSPRYKTPRTWLKRAEMLKTTKMNNGYLRIGLRSQNRAEELCLQVHVLVALVFIGPNPDGLDVAHSDGRKQYNYVGNLRYASRSENTTDQYILQERSNWLSVKDIRYARDLIAQGCTRMDLVRALGITYSVANRLWSGNSYIRVRSDKILGHQTYAPHA